MYYVTFNCIILYDAVRKNQKSKCKHCRSIVLCETDLFRKLSFKKFPTSALKYYISKIQTIMTIKKNSKLSSQPPATSPPEWGVLFPKIVELISLALYLGDDLRIVIDICW